MARVDPDTNPAMYVPAGAARAIFPLVPEDELETPPLPREHPKWVKDALAVSQRARALVNRIKPLVVKVLTFWDHRARAATIGGRELTVDVSGSYRLD